MERGCADQRQCRRLPHQQRPPRRATRAQSRTRFMGMEVHQATRAVASVAHAPGAAVTALGTLGRRPWEIEPGVRPMPAKAPPLIFVEAAGPGGDGRSRSLTKKDSACGGVAPALRPKTAGDRGQTDRRDAVPLARLARSGTLPVVSGPTGDAAARRALPRARAAPRSALQDAPWRRNALVRRHDRRAPGPAPGGPAQRRGRAAGVCPPPAQPSVCPA